MTVGAAKPNKRTLSPDEVFRIMQLASDLERESLLQQGKVQTGDVSPSPTWETRLATVSEPLQAKESGDAWLERSTR
jgi:hypothetical protein